MATLKDIALRSGVSTATVSYVLNNGPRNVSAEKKERVLAAIRELNYRPHAAARQLKGKSTGTIGVVFPHAVAAPMDNAYFAPVLAGILDVMTAERTSCMLFTGADWLSTEAEISQYSDGRCDGLLLIAAPKDSSLFVELDRRSVQYVLIGTCVEAMAVSSVDVDNELGGRLAAEHLIQLGHRHLAMIQGNVRSSSNDERTRGFLSACAPLKPRLLPAAYQYEVALQAARKLLREHTDVTGVFCANDLIAQAMLEAAREFELRVPEDLSIVGFDDYSFASLTNPPLTTVRQPLRQIGTLAAEQILRQARSGSSERVTIRLAPVLVARGSTGPALA
ncbi:MAG TPA: LacI family DNA-binding transcriptional regulator [Fimbriimonas sp.]|nr:LacI family DNA-binding transcriptional regulator [Fimbriimonas sp.]